MSLGRSQSSSHSTRRRSSALAESDLLRARINYQIALAAVDHATGNILQPYDVQIADLAPQ